MATSDAQGLQGVTQGRGAAVSAVGLETGHGLCHVQRRASSSAPISQPVAHPSSYAARRAPATARFLPRLRIATSAKIMSWNVQPVRQSSQLHHPQTPWSVCHTQWSFPTCPYSPHPHEEWVQQRPCVVHASGGSHGVTISTPSPVRWLSPRPQRLCQRRYRWRGPTIAPRPRGRSRRDPGPRR